MSDRGRAPGTFPSVSFGARMLTSTDESCPLVAWVGVDLDEQQCLYRSLFLCCSAPGAILGSALRLVCLYLASESHVPELGR